jgi:hypothetical protein
MEKQNLIATFAISPNNEQKKNFFSIIGSTVVINNFELKLKKKEIILYVLLLN